MVLLYSALGISSENLIHLFESDLRGFLFSTVKLTDTLGFFITDLDAYAFISYLLKVYY